MLLIKNSEDVLIVLGVDINHNSWKAGARSSNCCVLAHVRKTVARADGGRSVSCNQKALAKYPYVHSQFALNRHCFSNPFMQANLLMLQEWKRTWLLIQTLCARPDIQSNFPDSYVPPFTSLRQWPQLRTYSCLARLDLGLYSLLSNSPQMPSHQSSLTKHSL